MHRITSWSFKSTLKDDLIEESGIGTTSQDKSWNPHSETGNLAIDCLLLRDLSFLVNSTRCNNPVPTHLIVTDSLSQEFNEFCHLILLHGPGRSVFSQQCLRSLLNLFQRAMKAVEKDAEAENRRAYLINRLRRPVSSGSLSIAVVVMFFLSLSNWGLSSLISSLTSLECWGHRRQCARQPLSRPSEIGSHLRQV